MTQDPDRSEPASTDPAKGASGVIEGLSRRLRAPLRHFFKKRNIPRDEIDDLVQDVFLRLATRPGIESMERLEGYLFSTASNLLRDRHRRLESHVADNHVSYDEDIHGGSLATHGPDRLLLGAQMVERLVAALYELPQRTRVVFTLYHLEDLPHQEIAQRVGIAVSTIEKHMSRANAHLIRRLEGL